MYAQLSSGHVDLADVLFLVAAIAFAVGLVLGLNAGGDGRPVWLSCRVMQLLGLLAFALGWFVL